ncbi:MAG: T9SS type A sorting domain-containing protein [Candidatus Cloacimonetes bacterium]|nr:T9SS type A sorting domain-containing protein [Candidatus Cloacimonadota bacterium]
MSKSLVFALACLWLAVVCLGAEAALPDVPEALPKSFLRPEKPMPALATQKGAPEQKTTPSWIFSREPISLQISTYDYMIGSYNNLPLNLIPSSAGGGYFLTWQGRTAPTSDRRSFYGYLDPAGNMINVAQIEPYGSGVQGYPAVAVDPVDGKPFYAWHQNVDADPEMEIVLRSDAFIAGIAGLFNNRETVIDNPVTITAPDSTVSTDNVFLWPSLAIGPSPVANERRLYLLGRQSCNVYLAQADFTASDIEMGTPLSWQYTSVPELNAWALESEPRRTHLSLEADPTGNVILAGYHDSDAVENDIDIFVCGNFGQGDWTRHSFSSEMPTWNPGDYFTDDQGLPYADDELHWKLMNSGHLNATLDSDGRLHIVGLWGLANADGGFYPLLQYVKQAVYDPVGGDLEIRDIYPQQNYADTYNVCFTPWDMEPPFGVVDEFIYDPVNESYYPLISQGWPFPHWDQTAHSDAMMFHYNNVKITRANPHGQMAVVWQDSKRAVDWCVYHYPGYEVWEHATDVYIAYSDNDGWSWFDPIVLNNVETPEFEDIKPMWVYPSDQMLFAGYQNGARVGKLGLMFYDDFTWGANVIDPPYHPIPDGGEVMFMELQIGYGWDADDPGQAPAPAILAQNWPNPFNPSTSISFELLTAGPARLDVYDLRGRLVTTLLDKELGTGTHSLDWDGTDANGAPVASGVYLYRLSSGGSSVSRKMVLIK